MSDVNWLIRLRVADGKVKDLSGNTWTNNNVTFSSGLVGQQAMHFDKSSLTISSENASFNLGTKDFTLAVWVKMQDANKGLYSSIIGHQGTWASKFSANFGSSEKCTPYIQVGTGNDSGNYASSITFDFNTATHLALTRKDGIFYIFVNGKLGVTVDSRKDAVFDMYQDGLTMIGYDGYQSNSYLYGDVDDLCLIGGQALWTSDFIPPTGYLSISDKLYVSSGGGQYTE